MSKAKSMVPMERIEKAILFIRDHKVMLDYDLAEVYGVTTKRLNEQVKRNLERFPSDFMFQLTMEEFENLRSQFATTKLAMRRNPPYAFTEHGAVMLANVLNSQSAINASVQVVRVFIRLREMLIANKDLARRLDMLESKYDKQFKVVFDAIRELMTPTVKDKRRIGFRTGKGEKK